MASLQSFLEWAFEHSEDFNKVFITLIAFGSLVLSIFVAFVAPLVQAMIARRAAIDNISAKRQDWINGLRNDVAELITQASTSTMVIMELRRSGNALTSEMETKMQQVGEKAQLARIKATLRLNPNEEAHKVLAVKLSSFGEAALAFRDIEPSNKNAFRECSEKFNALERDVIRDLQAILKSEWNRIRDGRK